VYTACCSAEFGFMPGTRRWQPRQSSGGPAVPPVSLSAGGNDGAAGPRVAVVGSGPAALACVRGLAVAARQGGALAGARVTWCTSRGKLASQMGPRNQTPCQPGKPYHDYGCQYFTANDPGFVAEVERWEAIGLCRPLPKNSVGTIDSTQGFVPFTGQRCWVGNGGMAPMMFGLVRQTIEEFQDVLEHVAGFPDESQKVQALTRSQVEWTLMTKGGCSLGPFDIVVGAFSQHCLTDPFLKSGGTACADMLACLRSVESNQIVAMQVIFEGEPVNALFTLAHVVGDEDLSCASNNSCKPQQSGDLGTPGSQHWTLLSTAKFAETEFNCNPHGYRRVAEMRMLAAFARVLGVRDLASHKPRIQRINHWEDGLPMNTPPTSRGCLFDVSNRLGWCGDFCVAPCVQGAWLSGTAMASEIAAYWADPGGFDEIGLLPSCDKPWPPIHAVPGACQVDIGAFSALQGLLPPACTHTDLVPSAIGGYDKDVAHTGASGKAGRKGSGKGPYGGHGSGKGKGRMK